VGSPSESWDVRVTAGPFVCATITTAIVWRWEPQSRVTLRPRPLLALTLAAALIAAVAGAALAWVVAAAIVVACIAEAIALKQRTDHSLRFTTAQARQ
jgi:hypothetical protein